MENELCNEFSISDNNSEQIGICCLSNASDENPTFIDVPDKNYYKLKKEDISKSVSIDTSHDGRWEIDETKPEQLVENKVYVENPAKYTLTDLNDEERRIKCSKRLFRI